MQAIIKGTRIQIALGTRLSLHKKSEIDRSKESEMADKDDIQDDSSAITGLLRWPSRVCWLEFDLQLFLLSRSFQGAQDRKNRSRQTKVMTHCVSTFRKIVANFIL